MRSRNLREERQYVVDRKVQRYHGARIAPLDAILQEIVLHDKLLLHGAPHDLQQVLLVAQVLLHLFVQRVQALFHLARRILGNHLAQLLLRVGHLVANLRLLDAVRDLQLHVLEE